MASPRKRTLTLAALLVAVATGASLLTWSQRQAERQDMTTAAVVPAPAEPAESAPPAPPPGAEVVPPEEAETDRGPAAATPSGPTLSFARAAGLHLAPDPLRLNSSAALLVNQDTGEVLVRKNDQAVLPIASLTKLMSALLVLEANQPMDEMLTITEEDVDKERHSRSRLRVGTQLTRQEALHLALMSSENRAAHALGRTYPGGLDKMVQAMNARAQQLGMKNTTYVDPTGLSNRNQSTARDLAVLMGTVARHPQMREFSTTPAHLASLGGRTLQYVNSNRLVRRAGWDIELQKTGYIVEAGRCLTMVTEVGGRDVIMVLLDAETNGARLSDAERMRRWVLAEWGLPDPVVMARKAAPERKVAGAKKQASDGKEKKTVVARKDKESAKKEKSTSAGKEKTAVASKSQTTKKPATKADATRDKAARTQQAKKKDGRVSQTFAGTRDGDKG